MYNRKYRLKGDMNKNIKKIPIKHLTQLPESGKIVEVVRDSYWAVSEDNCVFQYKDCGFHRNDSEKLARRHYESREYVYEIRQIPVMFVPVEL